MGELHSKRLCAAMKDEVTGTTNWRDWGPDTGNSEALSKTAGQTAIDSIPVLPNSLNTLTKPWLVRWAEWVKAGRPTITNVEALEWNPALHPRGPDGKFVERPYDVPEGVDTSALGDMSPTQLLQEIDAAGGDVNAVLQDENVSVDGVPDKANNIGEIEKTAAAYSTATEAAEHIESTHGITAEIDNFSNQTAVEIAKAVDEIAAEYDISDLARIESDIDDRTPNAIAQFDRRPDSDEGDAILINPDENREKIQRWHDEGQHVSSDYKGIVTHELGHALTRTEGTNPFDRWNEEAPNSVIEEGSETYEKIDTEISGYANSRWPELVAETFAAVKAEGKDIDEIPSDILSLYQDLGGPKLE